MWWPTLLQGAGKNLPAERFGTPARGPGVCAAPARKDDVDSS